MLSAVGVLTIASCSKSKNEPTPEEPIVKGCTVKTIENIVPNNGNSEDKRFYTYDQNKNVTRIDFAIEKSTDFQTFSYAKDKIIKYSEHLEDGEKETEELTYKLDAQGRVVSITEASQSSTILFSYNAEGFLSEAKETDPEDKTVNTKTYTYTNGNLTKVVNQTVGVSGVEFTNTSTITYSNEFLNNDVVSSKVHAVVIPDDMDDLTAFMGKRSKNLPTQIVTVENYIPMPQYNRTFTIQFTYQKDAKENVTSLKLSQTSIPVETPYQEEFKFTYNCD